MTEKKVIVAGHICLDITPVFPEKKVTALGDLLQPGKLINMQGVNVHTGGAVANTGLAMKLLGADVSLMGKAGKDAFGTMVCNILQKYDAADGMILSEEESTSYSVVLAAPTAFFCITREPITASSRMMCRKRSCKRRRCFILVIRR